MNVRQARQELKKTLKEVADTVATDVGNLSRIERGQVPGRELAERLIAFYEGRITWASFYETPDPLPPESTDPTPTLRSADPDRRASEPDRRHAQNDRRDLDRPEIGEAV